MKTLIASGSRFGGRPVALKGRAAEHPDDALALYNLGCFTVAAGDLGGAMDTLAKIHPLDSGTQLGWRVQSLFLMICGMNQYRAQDSADGKAMYGLGLSYQNGYGVKELPDKAKYWYRNAANAGNAEAMVKLAGIYEHESGATVDTKEAQAWYQRECLAWYRKASSLGNQEAIQWLATHDL